MAFNGSGVFQRLYNWVNDAAAGIKIRADRMDAEMDGFATGLSNCITKDGQTTVTGNLPMTTYRHTNVGAGTDRADYCRLDQTQDGKLNWVAAGGTADAITANYSIALTALVDGQICFVRAGFANTTTVPTFAPNGLTARTIVKRGGDALAVGNIAGAGHELALRYDLSNTRWELLNPAEASIDGDNSFTGKLSLPDAGELTIASGAITVTGTYHTIDNEGDASSDDLDTINGMSNGQIAFFSAEHTDRTPVLKHSTGNILTQDGKDVTLDDTTKRVIVQYDAALDKVIVLAGPLSNYYTKTEVDAAVADAGKFRKYDYAEDNTYKNTSSNIPKDNTIPQITEGDSHFEISYTPTASDSVLLIKALVPCDVSGGVTGSLAMFVDSGANAVAAVSVNPAGGNGGDNAELTYRVVAGSTSSRTYKIRYGAVSGNMYVNGITAGQLFGGVMRSSLEVFEYAP